MKPVRRCRSSLIWLISDLTDLTDLNHMADTVIDLANITCYHQRKIARNYGIKNNRESRAGAG